jgi:exodeoxyribonuclease III
MKIATFNINNVNKRLQNLLAWLRTAKPDVACLQELKCTDEKFPESAIGKAGYGAVWRGQSAWNGVAILARGCEPVLTRRELPSDPQDAQARYIEAAVNGVLIASLYAPNGNPQPGPKFAYKLAWMERLLTHARELYAAGVPVVLAGDYNVVPTDRDIYPTTSYRDNALVQPAPRAQFQRLLKQGWVDAVRALHPDAPMYTFWHYMRNRWPRDAGLRLDHLLLSAEAAKRLKGSGVDREVRGADNASDHAPAWIVLRDERHRTGSSPAKRGRGTASEASGGGGESRIVAAPPSPPSAVLPPLRGGRKPPSSPSPGQAGGPALPPLRRARTKQTRPLLVIDGDSFAHRAYHGVPKTIFTRDGQPANAILGFANILLRLYRTESPRAVLVGWDTLEAPTYRHKALPGYQGGREFDDAILQQLRQIPKFVAACGFANAKGRGFEADDFLAAAVRAGERRGGTVLVASGDRDSFQLASDRTTILYPLRAGEMARIGPAEVRERYGVDPKQVPDFIALRGDPSDRIPGAPGVGAQGAAELLRKYGSLEALLKAGRFAAQVHDLKLFKSIATMSAKAPLPPLTNQRPTWRKAAALARRWGLNQLATRLDTFAEDDTRNTKRAER